MVSTIPLNLRVDRDKKMIICFCRVEQSVGRERNDAVTELPQNSRQFLMKLIVTLQMGTGDCINIFMAAQPCNTANGNWGLRQYLHGCSAL